MEETQETIERRMPRKAQTEIFGLAIVVVLLAFGMVLVVSFSSQKVPDELQALNKELAEKFVNALVHTDTGCDSIGNLIDDFVEFSAQEGSFFCDFAGESIKSGQYLNRTLEFILTTTWGQWRPYYKFRIYVNEETPLFFMGNNSACTPESLYLQPYNLGNINYFIELRVCDK